MNLNKKGYAARLFGWLCPSGPKKAQEFRLKTVVPTSEVNPGSLGKILIVDDDPITLKTASVKLQAEGFAAVTAADGSEAMTRIRDDNPDLILLDIVFPPDIGGVAWDGFVLLQWLRTLGPGKMPVLLISTDAARYEDRVLTSGALGIFDKPLDYEQLLPTIKQLVEERQRANALGI